MYTKCNFNYHFFQQTFLGYARRLLCKEARSPEEKKFLEQQTRYYGNTLLKLMPENGKVISLLRDTKVQQESTNISA